MGASSAPGGETLAGELHQASKARYGRRAMAAPLLIFDLDETLVFSTEEPLARAPDFRVGPYSCYRRPGADELLAAALEHFRVAVWSTSSTAYARGVAQALFAQWGALDPLEFVWSRPHCDKALHSTLGVEIWVKDLSRLEAEGYSLTQTLIIDDSPEKICRQPRNLLQVSLYLGEHDDGDLSRLAATLPELARASDLRERSSWRTPSR
jgi:RNA polymerase II subunit A small phosphatase-like protein